MTRNEKGLVRQQVLTDQDRDAVEQLAARCRQHEGLALGWILEPPGPVPDHGTNQLLYYEAGALVGFMSLPPGLEIELCGLVHPQHRRRGIGRALLTAAREEYRQRGVLSLLLVCEPASGSGKAFVEAVGARYCDSEYQMELDRAALSRRVPPQHSVQLQRASIEDTEALIRLTAASFGDPVEQVRQRIVQWLRESSQRFYMAKLHEEPIGSLRVFMIPDASCVSIYTFGVLPDYRGRGYGRQILAETIYALLAEGWKQILIEVNTENRSALSVYHACGFKEIATYGYYELEV
jgi:ribosomal protein S18 acetylase RimI-like enzyme